MIRAFAGFTREMLITQILQLRDLVTMEQASLASAREEIAKLREGPVCTQCGDTGSYPDHHPSCDPNSQDACMNCPMEVECQCRGQFSNGSLREQLATERAAREREKAHFYEQWTLEEARFLEMLHRAERAEARVSDLERSIVDWETEPQYRVTNLNWLHSVARAILARAKEGESRG